MLIRCRCFNPANIGSVTCFCHGETTGYLKRTDSLDIFFMMLFCSQEINAHSPKSKLHAELDHQAEIVVTQRFHNREVCSHIPAPTVLFWICHGAITLFSKKTAP